MFRRRALVAALRRRRARQAACLTADTPADPAAVPTPPADAPLPRARFRLFAPYRRDIAYAGMLSDTFSNICASLLLVAFGVLLFANSTFQFSLFTWLRNLTLDPGAVYAKAADIRGIAIDDAAAMAVEEQPKAYPGGQFDAIAAAIEQLSDYAAAEVNRGRAIVVGIDYVFDGDQDPRAFDRLRAAIAAAPPNLKLVLGGALDLAGTTRGYYRINTVRDNLLGPILAERGPQALDGRVFMGSLHYIRGRAVSGLETLDNDIALGYQPLVVIGDPALPTTSIFPALPVMMYLAGHAGAAAGNLAIQPDGYLDPAALGAAVPLLAAAGFTTEYLADNPLWYNFFSPDDLAAQELGCFNYLPIGAVVNGLGPQPASPLGSALLGRTLGPLDWYEKHGREAPAPGGSEYFFIYRAQSHDFVGAGASTDLVITPASCHDDFTNTTPPVSGVMTHITGLSNLLRGDAIRPAPAWLETLLALILLAISLVLALRAEFRTAMLGAATLGVIIVLLSFGLFLGSVFLPCRLPLMGSIGFILVVSIVRFLATLRQRGEV